MQLAKVEREVIGLWVAYGSLNSMINHALLKLVGHGGVKEVHFETLTHQQLFNILLLDFLEKVDVTLTGEQGSCLEVQGTVPQAITAFLESNDFEDAIRNAISLGGDTDTLACITGGIAQAFYGGVPDFIVGKVMEILDQDLRTVTSEFMAAYCGRT